MSFDLATAIRTLVGLGLGVSFQSSSDEKGQLDGGIRCTILAGSWPGQWLSETDPDEWGDLEITHPNCAVNALMSALQGVRKFGGILSTNKPISDRDECQVCEGAGFTKNADGSVNWSKPCKACEVIDT